MPAKFTTNDPEVVAILHGVMRAGIRTYCRVAADGSTYVVPIRAELVALGLSPKQATELLVLSDLPVTQIIRKEPVPPEPDPQAMLIAAIAAAAKEMEREEKLAKKAEAAKRGNNKRWQEIETNSGKYGIWDNDSGSVISLYWTREEAIEELVRLRAGSSQDGVYYNSRKSRQPDLMEVHY